MDKVSLAVTLIRSTSNQTLRWLARLNEFTMQLEFVVGERLEKESFHETAIREVAWELDLDRTRDFLVANMAQHNLEFVDQLPGWFSKNHLLVSFYNVEIYRREVLDALEQDSRNFWVTSDEICKGVTQCGCRFDPIIPYLINRSNVIQHWESSQAIDRSSEH